MKGMNYVASFFAITLSLCFFGATYGAEPKQVHCDIGSYGARGRVSETPISETLRHIPILATKIYGEEIRLNNGDDSIALLLAKNTVEVAYSFDLVNAKKNLNPAMAAACDKFLSMSARVSQYPALK